MALDPDLVSITELSKTLECGICLNTVCNPKRLACNHSFCRSCLDKILVFSPNAAHATIKCPNGCQKETDIHWTKTTNDLETDFMLKGVLDFATKHQQKEIEGKCSGCTRRSVRYCTKCSLLRCAECEDDHDEVDQTKSSELFIAVDFNINEPKGVIMCDKHHSEATHLCCETQYLCTYCANGGAHSTHKPVLLSDFEQKVKDSMLKKIDANPDYKQRLQDATDQIRVAEEGLSKELTSRKIRSLLDCKMALDREEKQMKEQFQKIQKSYLDAFEAVSQIEGNIEEDSFTFLLKQSEISKKLETVYLDSSKPIPGVTISLTNRSDVSPLGSIEIVYCSKDSCNEFKTSLYSTPIETELQSLMNECTTFLEIFNKDKAMTTNEVRHENIEIERDIDGSTAVSENHADGNEKADEECESREKSNIKGINEDVHRCLSVDVASLGSKTVKRTVDFSFQLMNISKVYEEMLSDPVIMGSYVLRLQLRFCYRNTSCMKVKYAGFFLYCYYNGIESNWSLTADVIMTLRKSFGQEICKTGTANFDKDTASRGWKEFVPWSELMDSQKGLVGNDSITIDVNITSTFDNG